MGDARLGQTVTGLPEETDRVTPRYDDVLPVVARMAGAGQYPEPQGREETERRWTHKIGM
jgi:hypothetical protein